LSRDRLPSFLLQKEGHSDDGSFYLEEPTIPSAAGKKWGLIALAVLLVLVVGGAVGFRIVAEILRDNRITMNFVLEGDINNPQFSPNEALTTRVAASMAETLGVSIKGVVEGIGILGRKGIEDSGIPAKV
jgi:hypothetical protein